MKNIFTVGAAVLLSINLLGQSLSGVESVEYDPINNRYLASSDNSSIVAIAPNGGLSYFGAGTQASYGMEIFGGYLYAIEGSQIRCYSLTTESLVFGLTITGAQFLNGMGSNGVDKLWVSDFNGYDIYEIDVTDINTPTFTMVADQTDLGTTNKPNGIVYDGANNRIIIVSWGSNAPIKAMDLTSYSVTTVAAGTGLGNIDGIDQDGNGNWFIAAWSPASITKYNSDFSAIIETLNVPGINNPADICYAPETDTLAIPGGDQIIFIGFESSSIGIEEENFENHRVFYNSGYPVVQFELSSSQDARFDILDVNGRVVYTAMEGVQPIGKHSVVLSSIGLYSGAYLCRLTSKELSFTDRVIIP